MHLVAWPRSLALAWMSALVKLQQLAEEGVINSPSSGSNGGSTATSWQTSCSQAAVKSRNLLWQIKVNPPWRKIIAWSTLIVVPQTQWLGALVNCHLYLKHSASINSCLFKWNSFSCNVRAVSKSEENFTLINLMDHRSWESTQDLILVKLEDSNSCMDCQIVKRACWRKDMWKCSDCYCIIATKLALSSLDDLYNRLD